MDSAFAKLERAKVHFAALQCDVDEYKARKPIGFEYRHARGLIDTDLTIVRVIARVKEPIPEYWSLYVGDILTNLRAALDHAVFGHAARRKDLDERQEATLSFPIKTSLGEWRRMRKRLELLVAPDVLDSMEEVQPFTDPDGFPDRHPLAVFNKLVNQDKHRAIQPVSMVNTRMTLLHSTYDLEKLEPREREIADGVQLAKLTFRMPPFLPVEVEPTFQLQNAYVESIQLPPGSFADHFSVIATMQLFITGIEQFLEYLKTKGC